MTRVRPLPDVWACAGLWMGSLAWILNTQLGPIVAHLECEARLPLLAVSSGALAVLALAFAYVSWRSANIEPRAETAPANTADFVRTLSTLAGGLFAFALLLQGAASLLLTGCEQ